MTALIAPIVEGETEVACVERLLHRIWGEILQRPNRLQITPFIRGKRDRLLSKRETELENRIQQCLYRLKDDFHRQPDASRSILLLLDADDACPVELAEQIRDRSQGAVPAEVSFHCVFAKWMLENWIVAGRSTLGNESGLPEHFDPVNGDVDQLRGANWLNEQIRRKQPNRKYRKTVDASAFVRKMHLRDCERDSRSFRKLVSELAKIPVPDPLEIPPIGDDSDS